MERRLFEDLIESDVVAHKTGQGKTLPVSLVLHGIALVLIVIVPLLQPAELPEPAAAVKAFFVEPRGARRPRRRPRLRPRKPADTRSPSPSPC